MGKASRSKKQRTREETSGWTAAGAARDAHRRRRSTVDLLDGNPFVRAMLMQNVTTRMTELRTVLGRSNVPERGREDVSFAMTLGKQGLGPPWPEGPQQATDWQIGQILKTLREADVCVLSPGAHAAVMAAASTLEPADVVTLDRDNDIHAPIGFVVLPEPVVLVNRGGGISDTVAFGWQFITQHQVLPTSTYPGVQLTTFMDRDGPVQPAEWRMVVAQARANHMPLPPFVPDGMYGLRGDRAAAEKTDADLAAMNAEHRRLNQALNQVARPNTPSDVGEWDGGRIEDVNDDFAARYMFAFWRLASHGTTTIGPVAPRRSSPSPDATTPAAAERDVRVVRLTHQIPAQRTDPESPSRDRVYNRRWPVRMHKVRQWYPSLQEHRVIWRGPYIKGPADAPLVMGEKAYLVD
ncbi:hypothetical protein ACH4A7_37595 [Streptomyces cyaneofuscatus]|uniref:hypothetical protein n=1 Tax=Streptomyces cyaneofuscatus TaxID=66883 RepID=UPI003796DFFF